MVLTPPRESHSAPENPRIYAPKGPPAAISPAGPLQAHRGGMRLTRRQLSRGRGTFLGPRDGWTGYRACSEPRSDPLGHAFPPGLGPPLGKKCDLPLRASVVELLHPPWRGFCPARPSSMSAALDVVACCGPGLAGKGHPSQCCRLSVSSLGVVHRFGCPRGPQGCCRLLVCWFWDQRTYGPRMTTAGAGVCLEPPV
jgi:hypothetical protein